MEAVETSASAAESKPYGGVSQGEEQKQVKVRRKTLQEVLEQCQRALELLKNADLEPVQGDADSVKAGDEETEEEDGGDSSSKASASSVAGDSETDELCDLLKSKVESQDFLEKLDNLQASVYQNISEESTAWDVVTTTDLLEDKQIGCKDESDQDGYILVNQEDIVDGIACFMAAYLLSLKETKDLNPNQLQKALSKTFSTRKKKGKLKKAWDGSIVAYNVASWSATAIGIYQNPALLKAASSAFWTSCRVISKLF